MSYLELGSKVVYEIIPQKKSIKKVHNIFKNSSLSRGRTCIITYGEFLKEIKALLYKTFKLM